MPKYVPRLSEEVEAIQFTGYMSSAKEIMRTFDPGESMSWLVVEDSVAASLYLASNILLNCKAEVKVGDYVVRHTDGKLDLIRESFFDLQYKPVQS